jgi:hypothetical protein
MRIEIAKHERMSESGSSLMRLIQNNELPTLDLLVRESIQNSSDASLENMDTVNVSFNIKLFTPSNVNYHFEGISESLDKKFKQTSAKYLEIRDSNTTGLTGPLHHSEVENNQFGNLINLVYEISKPQQREGAGGSWGLGKTIYFRVGIGLVVYYSRVLNENGEYQSRLVACLVEDERKPDTLLQDEKKGPKRGIAWWGTKKDEMQTIPITDEGEINKFLDDFNIVPYEDEETGTSIIIPYISEEKLMHSAKSIYEERKQAQYWWLSSIEEYLRVCIQRWYAPRINNRGYAFTKSLNASVNGKVLIPHDMLPMFKVVQDLYNNCDYANDMSGNVILDKASIHREKINLRGIFNGPGEAGQLMFAKFSKEDLLMTPPNNHRSPYEQANVDYRDNDFTNPPLLCFLRKPGMIVNYDASGSWVSNITPSSEDEYVIGVFVPNSTNTLNEDLDSHSLEQYLRLGEKADHTSWNDWTVGERNPQIVSKIKGQVARKINQRFSNKNEKKYETRKTSIGKSLADILLPPENFGRQPISGRNSGRNNGGGVENPGKKSSLVLEDKPIYKDGQIHMPFKIKMGKFVKNTLLELRVTSESGNITANTWEKDQQIGSTFPLEMKKLSIEGITVNRETTTLNFVYDFDESAINLSNIEISKVKSERFAIPYGIKIKNNTEDSCTVSGTVSFKTTQGSIRGLLSTADEAGDN